MFCSGCGAELANQARFCERCGDRVEVDGFNPASARRSSGGVDPRLLGGVIAAVVVVATVVGLVVFGAFGRDEGETVAARHVSSPPAATPVPSPSPASTVASPDPETTARPRERPARARVDGTCGRGGVGGDCVLSVRARPSASSAELDRLAEGDALTVTCQVRGERVYSSARGASSTVWSRTTPRGYVANAYVDGPRLSHSKITLPRC